MWSFFVMIRYSGTGKANLVGYLLIEHTLLVAIIVERVTGSVIDKTPWICPKGSLGEGKGLLVLIPKSASIQPCLLLGSKVGVCGWCLVRPSQKDQWHSTSSRI